MTWLSNLFNRRFKGFRVVEIAAAGCLAVMILGVYAFKAGAGREGAQIADVDRQIAEESKRVRLLKAELTHLETPERLTRIASDDLGLAPADAKREAPVDSLPDLSRRVAAAPAAAAASAPNPAPVAR